MKISIITATYNSSKTISDCIVSVNNQTYQDIEQIIIDGNSNDNTLDLIRSQPNRVKVIVSEPDKNIYDALNKGISIATGDIIGFLHSDDFFESENIIEQIVMAFKESGANIVYGNIFYVEPKNPKNIIRAWKSNSFKIDDLKKGWMPPHTTLYVKHEIYDEYGTYDTSFKISAEYDLILRYFGILRISSFHLNLTFLRMRYGGTSNKFSNYIQHWKEDYRAIRTNNIGGFLTLFLKNFRKISQFF